MSKSTILLAEDDENLRFVVQDNLELRGFHVIAVENGEDAFSAFQESEIDLCIFDVMMPKLAVLLWQQR